MKLALIDINGIFTGVANTVYTIVDWNGENPYQSPDAVNLPLVQVPDMVNPGDIYVPTIVAKK